jgi:beta-galactosidase
MFIGAHYSCALFPHPRREDWERDLRLIKEHGVYMIRHWMEWSKINPKEGKWVWDDADRLFDLAQKNNLKVLIQVFPDNVPSWLKKKNLDKNKEKSLSKKYLTKVVKRYKDNPALHAIDLWNEPGGHKLDLPATFDRYIQEELRTFLKNKYRNIKKLNHSWNQSFTDFNEITEISGGGLANTIDKYEFQQWTYKKKLKWLYETVRKIDKKHLLASHFHGSTSSLRFAVSDPWDFGEILDVWGTGLYEKSLDEAALTFHGTSCSSRGKPWWLSEMAGGRTWVHVGDYHRSINFLRSCLVLAMSFRAEAVIFQQWRPDIFGVCSPHFGLTGLNGELTSRTTMIKNFTSMLHRHEKLFQKMFFPDPQIGLLWEPRTIAYEEMFHPIWIKSRLWLENFVGWHKALLESNNNFDILNSRIVANEGIQEKIRILIAPIQVFNREKMTEKIKTWIQKGGTLVTGPLYGLYDEYGFANKRVPPEWLGVNMYELYYPKQPIIRFVDEKLQYPEYLPATHFIEALKVEDAEVLGAVEEKIVATRKAYGKGEIIYIGTFVGNNYNYETSPQLQTFIKKLLLKSDIIPAVQASSGCYLKTAKSGEDTIIFLTNPRKKEVKTWLRFSNIKGTLINLLIDQEIGRIDLSINREKFVNIPLGSEESKILLLRLK